MATLLKKEAEWIGSNRQWHSENNWSFDGVEATRYLFNIIMYFEMTPAEFFAPLGKNNTPYSALCDRLGSLDSTDLEKVSTFLDWIAEQKVHA